MTQKYSIAAFLIAVALLCVPELFCQATHTIELFATGGNVGEVRFKDDDNSNLLLLRAPDTIGSNFALALPDALPGSTLCITVDTSGNMDYSACSGGGSLTVQES